MIFGACVFLEKLKRFDFLRIDQKNVDRHSVIYKKSEEQTHTQEWIFFHHHIVRLEILQLSVQKIKLASLICSMMQSFMINFEHC